MNAAAFMGFRYGAVYPRSAVMPSRRPGPGAPCLPAEPARVPDHSHQFANGSDELRAVHRVEVESLTPRRTRSVIFRPNMAASGNAFRLIVQEDQPRNDRLRNSAPQRPANFCTWVRLLIGSIRVRSDRDARAPYAFQIALEVSLSKKNCVSGALRHCRPCASACLCRRDVGALGMLFRIGGDGDLEIAARTQA